MFSAQIARPLLEVRIKFTWIRINGEMFLR